MSQIHQMEIDSDSVYRVALGQLTTSFINRVHRSEVLEKGGLARGIIELSAFLRQSVGLLRCGSVVSSLTFKFAEGVAQNNVTSNFVLISSLFIFHYESIPRLSVPICRRVTWFCRRRWADVAVSKRITKTKGELYNYKQPAVITELHSSQLTGRWLTLVGFFPSIPICKNVFSAHWVHRDSAIDECYDCLLLYVKCRKLYEGFR